MMNEYSNVNFKNTYIREYVFSIEVWSILGNLNNVCVLFNIKKKTLIKYYNAYQYNV